MKQYRLDKIVEIIENERIGTQEELMNRLVAEDFHVTQATISRDIRQLELTKVSVGRGQYRYMLPRALPEDIHTLQINHALADTIVRVEAVREIVVVHTYAGMAQAVASEIDRLALDSVLGSVAGDDTIIVVVRDAEIAERLVSEIQSLIRTGAPEEEAYGNRAPKEEA